MPGATASPLLSMPSQVSSCCPCLSPSYNNRRMEWPSTEYTEMETEQGSESVKPTANKKAILLGVNDTAMFVMTDTGNIYGTYNGSEWQLWGHAPVTVPLSYAVFQALSCELSMVSP